MAQCQELQCTTVCEKVWRNKFCFQDSKIMGLHTFLWQKSHTKTQFSSWNFRWHVLLLITCCVCPIHSPMKLKPLDSSGSYCSISILLQPDLENCMCIENSEAISSITFVWHNHHQNHTIGLRMHTHQEDAKYTGQNPNIWEICSVSLRAFNVYSSNDSTSCHRASSFWNRDELQKQFVIGFWGHCSKREKGKTSSQVQG